MILSGRTQTKKDSKLYIARAKLYACNLFSSYISIKTNVVDQRRQRSMEIFENKHLKRSRIIKNLTTTNYNSTYLPTHLFKDSDK